MYPIAMGRCSCWDIVRALRDDVAVVEGWQIGPPIAIVIGPSLAAHKRLHGLRLHGNAPAHLARLGSCRLCSLSGPLCAPGFCRCSTSSKGCAESCPLLVLFERFALFSREVVGRDKDDIQRVFQ